MANADALGSGSDRGRRQTVTGLGRRAFLAMLAMVGAGRSLLAQGQRRLRYLPLTRPVSVPLATLPAPGRVRRFVAQGVAPDTAANPGEVVRVNGMVTRVSEGDGDDAADQFRAVCRVCPHEQCEVDYVADPAELDPLVIEEIGTVEDPVYICPCHNSTFSTADGARLGGPAPRGLYQFRVTNVSDTHIEIGEVEEDVLLFF